MYAVGNFKKVRKTRPQCRYFFLFFLLFPPMLFQCFLIILTSYRDSTGLCFGTKGVSKPAQKGDVREVGAADLRAAIRKSAYQPHRHEWMDRIFFLDKARIFQSRLRVSTGN
jgi:hypothetical protein